MPLSHPWHVYPGRHWSLSETEEEVFVAELERLGGRSRGSQFNRGDTTALLNALRCGIEPHVVLDACPGLKADRVAAGWRDLKVRLAKARGSWERILAEPSWHVLADHAFSASLILPIPVRRLTAAANTLRPQELEGLVAEIVAECAIINVGAAACEAELATLVQPSERGVKIGRVLYDPYQPSLWGHPYYVPTRPGTLMPVKVADLLGERRR